MVPLPIRAYGFGWHRCRAIFRSAYVFWPQHGEYANSTNFVTSPVAESALQFEIAPRQIAEIAIFSDGLENLLLHHASKTVHEPFFRKILSPLRSTSKKWDEGAASADLSQFLMSPMICNRTDDDKSLVLAVRNLG
jgi:hypothetical protein